MAMMSRFENSLLIERLSILFYLTVDEFNLLVVNYYK